MNFRKQIVLATGLSIVWIVFCPTTAYSQRGQRMMVQSQQGALMPPPREVEVLMDELRGHIAGKQWSEATLAIGLLLGLEETSKDSSTGVDYFLAESIDERKSPGPLKSVFRQVFEMIESMPSEASKFVDLRYGLSANQTLEQAIARLDWKTIEQVAGKYFFTTAGQDACLVMGEYWLRKGDPRRAARFLERAFRQKSALSRMGGELGILLAASYEAAGMQADAFRTLEECKRQFNSFSMTWNGNRVGWESRETKTKDIMQSIHVDSIHPAHRIVKQPLYLGGDPKRNADTLAGTPLPIVRWHTELHESKQQKENSEKVYADKLLEGKSTTIPSRVPISVGRWIIASTYDQRIVAIDALTGRLGWECFYSGMPLGFSMDRFPTRDSHSLNLAAADYLVKRVWGETAVGIPSSDGKRVYSVSELPAIEIAESFAMGQNARVAKPQAFRTYNVLQCWSVPEEGKIAWEVGGQKSPIEPLLAGALFLGAPLPHDGELLVIGELNSDLYLFSLKPENGKLLWRQPLATNAGAIATDSMRRSIGMVPSVDGSIAICPTMSGYLIAFDLVSKELLWSFDYKIKNVSGALNQVGLFGQQEIGEYSPFLSRSVDTAPLIHDGVVLFAPSDGEGEIFYGISADTGMKLWQSEVRRDSVRYVACAWNGTAYFACQSSIIALDLKTGKPKWPSIELPNDAQVVGRGVRAGGQYYLPTSKQEILQIDLERGAITESVQVEKPLGNLVSMGERIISASPFQLDCYAVREAFQSQLKEELQRSTVSATGLARQGELALAKNEYDAALNFLEQAKKLEPNNAEVAILLNKVGLAALTADFDKYVDRVQLSQNLAYDKERVPYLRMMIHGLQRQKRFKDAIIKLLELSEMRTSQRRDQLTESDLTQITSSWSIQEDRWIQTQIARCLSEMPTADKQVIEEWVTQRISQIANEPANMRRMVINHLDAIGKIEDMRSESAMELIQQKDYLQAESLLVSEAAKADFGTDSVEMKRRRQLLSEVYARSGRTDLALKYLDGDENLLRKMLATIPEARTRATESRPASATKPVQEWPRQVAVSTSHFATSAVEKTQSLESMQLCRWKSRIGDALQSWDTYFSQGDIRCSMQEDQIGYRTFVDVRSDKVIPTVYSVDSILLLEMSREIIALNTLSRNSDQRGALWRESFESVVAEERGRGQSGNVNRSTWGIAIPRTQFRVVAVSRKGIVVQHEDNLIALDLSTGKRIWTTTGFKDCQFAEFNNELMVYHPKLRKISRLDLRDGSRLSEMPFEADLVWVATVGKYWLMESANQSRLLQLIDPKDGRVVFTRQFSIDTRIGMDGDAGVLLLQDSGLLTYWRLHDEMEFVSNVEVEGATMNISVQRFGDTILVLPFSKQLQIDIGVAPLPSDPAFAQVAGRVIAISASSGQPAWEQSKLAWQTAFPLAQRRNLPIAVFVRRLTLKNVGGIDVDSMSMTVLDIRDGRILFSKDDMPAVRDRGFVQKSIPEENTISLDYLGSNVTLKFVESDASNTPVDESKYEFGDVNMKEFRSLIEARVKEKSK